jgi:hypothetical protein
MDQLLKNPMLRYLTINLFFAYMKLLYIFFMTTLSLILFKALKGPGNETYFKFLNINRFDTSPLIAILASNLLKYAY